MPGYCRQAWQFGLTDLSQRSLTRRSILPQASKIVQGPDSKPIVRSPRTRQNRGMENEATQDIPQAPALDLSQRKGLLFALTAERLSVYYEHDAWLTVAQGASLAADWLHRSKLPMSLKERRAISDLSDSFARELANTLSPQAGLFTAHEMMEGLDHRYQSSVTTDLLEECERLLQEHQLDAPPAA